MSKLTLRGPTCRCLYNAQLLFYNSSINSRRKKPRKCYASPREAFESVPERIGWAVKEVRCGILTAPSFLLPVSCTDKWATALNVSSLVKQSGVAIQERNTTCTVGSLPSWWVEMEKVISCFKKRPEAVTRLICFPWAGGGSIHYARWGNVLSSSIEGKHT